MKIFVICACIKNWAMLQNNHRVAIVPSSAQQKIQIFRHFSKPVDFDWFKICALTKMYL